MGRQGTKKPELRIYKLNGETQGQSPNFIELAGDIVAAYVSNNHVAPADLPAVIASVHAAIAGLASDSSTAPAEAPVEQPSAVEIRKSMQPDGIVSFIDGRSYKTLKRHLTAHGLTPVTYCTRYGLPADYPMVAPSYSAQRSNLAKAIGLGVPGAQGAQDEAPAEAEPPRKGGRRKVA